MAVERIFISSTGISTYDGWYEKYIFGVYRFHSLDRRGNNIFYANIRGTDRFVHKTQDDGIWMVSKSIGETGALKNEDCSDTRSPEKCPNTWEYLDAEENWKVDRKLKVETSAEDFETSQLNQHNSYRASHRVGSLALDSELTSYAQNYAESLAYYNSYEHSRTSQGENLFRACSSEDYPSGEGATAEWYSENRNYDYYSGDSSNGGDIGYFTQLVWKNTRKFGIARATGRDGDLYCTWVVGRYLPAGNFPGEYIKNVKSG